MGLLDERDWRACAFEETEETGRGRGDLRGALGSFYGVRLKESAILHLRSPAAKKESAAGAAWPPHSFTLLPFIPSLPLSRTHGCTCTRTHAHCRAHTLDY